MLDLLTFVLSDLSAPAPQNEQPPRAEDGHQRRKDDARGHDSRLGRSNVFGERTLYIIFSPNAPAVAPAPTTVSPAAPAIPALPPRVLSTAKITCAAMWVSPGTELCPGP
jgi:hypothetical protein